MKQRRFAEGGETAEEKLGKYIRIPSEAVGGKFPVAKSKLPAASRAARLAAGEDSMENSIRDYAASEAEEGDKLRPFAKNVLAGERQKISELADQYKRETRGKVPGAKKGGMTASSRGDGIAQRGKTKGRMV